MTDAMQTQVLDFWFGALGPDGKVAPEKQARWWKKSSEFDVLCREQFEEALRGATQATANAATATARGALAFIILCDQLSRNMYRDTPGAFATDSLALAVTQKLISSELLKQLSPVEKSFALMPLMHSEELSVQEQSVQQFTALAEEGHNNLDFAKSHKKIIDQFGRYPHRNAIMGRESTPEELRFLDGPGSSF
tara:strand:+ start:32077 stop:32658 length:582 start_codon:yes stop_codon:yes gene_type:complete